jgi:uncharacterized protein YmfQ (DUF2313 family)
MADQHVRRSGADYAQAFLQLLPQGQAWPRQPPESTMVQGIEGLCDYWGYVDGNAADLLEIESDPRSTIALLPDWERNWGLPDPCYTGPLTIHDRQIALVLRMTMMGGQSIEFFIGVAAFLGYTVTITEYAPFMVGVSNVGDTRTPPLDPNPLVGEYRWYIGPPEMRFYWTVHVTGARLTWFRVTQGQLGVDHHLEIGLAEDLECLLNRWKPAHTEIIFDYSNIGGQTDDPMAGTP